MKSISPIPHEEIAARAYNIWEQNGRPEGNDGEYWFRAERELQREREQADSGNAGVGSNVALLSAAKNGSAKGKRATASPRASAG